MKSKSFRQRIHTLFPQMYQRLSRVKSHLMIFPNRYKARRLNQIIYTRQEDLIAAHFAHWVKDFQKTMPGFQVAFDCLKSEPARIIETGTSAWGIDSTRLLDAYIRNFGGEFWTIDIRKEPSNRLKGTLTQETHCIIGDSVLEIEKLDKSGLSPVDLIYLDSYDLDWADPYPSALHGLKEWRAIRNLVGPGTLVLIDDTPRDLANIPKAGQDLRAKAEVSLRKFGYLPGKGALILKEVQSRNDVEVIYHEYNLLLRFK